MPYRGYLPNCFTGVLQLADGVEKVDGGQQKHPQPHGQGDHPVDLVTEDEQHPHRGPGQAEGQRRVADGIPPVGQGAKTDTAGDQEREQKMDDEVPQGGLPGQQGGGEEQGEQSQVHQTKQNHPGGVTNQLVQTVRGYIRECLQWMIDDGVVSRIDLDIRRTGINELGNSITLWRRDGPVMISFDDLWSAITHGGQ